MAVYKCSVCDTEYDEEKEDINWQDLPEDWVCPVCDSPKSMFQRVEDVVSKPQATVEIDQHAVKTISDLRVDTMVNWGVTAVFGMVGHSNLGLSDAIRRQCEAGNLNFIGIRHEGAASFAASAYAKLSGRPAACLAIAGPGATNLLTGLWDAKLDRVPVLALTGQVDFQFLGPGAFQEVNLAAAFEAVSCWSQTALESSNLSELNDAMKNLFAHDGPAMLEILTDAEPI